MTPGKLVRVSDSLSATNSKLALEWHPTKNLPLSTSEVRSTTPRKAWWVCNEGHEFEAQIRHRNSGSNCPYCAGQKVLSGFNDLLTTSPGLAQEWHPTKNGFSPKKT